MKLPHSPQPPLASAVEPLLAPILASCRDEEWLTARELAEVIWLAARLPASMPSQTLAAQAEAAPAEAPEPLPEVDTKASPSQGASVKSDRPSRQPAQPEAIAAANLLPSAVLPAMEDVEAMLPVWLDDPPLLANQLSVLRGLGTLLRGVPSLSRLRLDEDDTVEAFARAQVGFGRGVLLQPVMRPLLEPRFDLLLVLDQGLSMGLWDRLIQDLLRMFRGCGGFRRLRVVPLVDPATLDLLVDQSQVANPEQRQLVLVISDCHGKHWWREDLWRWLSRWTATAPTALLQLMPRWRWQRSALGRGEPVSLRNDAPASAPAHYLQRPIRLRHRPSDRSFRSAASSYNPKPEQTFLLPVLTSEPVDLALWAQVVMGDSRDTMSGVCLPMSLHERLQDGAAPAAEMDVRSEERRIPLALEEFTTLASPEARELLRLLAAAPVLTLPVMRLVKTALMGFDPSPLAMAEVLVSGLLERLDSGRSGEKTVPVEQWQFDFQPGIRDLLLEVNSAYDTVTVLNAVTRLVELRWNRFSSETSFQAFLNNPSLLPPPGLEGVHHFAEVAAHIIERLGGEYVTFADALRRGANKKAVVLWPEDQFQFEQNEGEAAMIMRLPELSSHGFRVAEYQDIPLQTFQCQTAWLEQNRRIDQDITRHGFVETLQESGAIHLDLLHIPSGRFPMGSPANERGHSTNEGPQHEVELGEFFLGRTPITQAQWRAVAEWQPRPGEDPWPMALDPDPVAKVSEARRFLGKQRPVLNVSWKEAMEFCRRLQQRTGKNYTLPSEAQWEYACRAGTTTPFHFGETISPELANYDGNFTYSEGKKGEYRRQTTDVASFPANAWGLCDMHGNVWEWCLDHWHGSYEGAPSDGKPWLDTQTGKSRLLRGGSWSGLPDVCRSAYRFGNLPGLLNRLVGFRVCCLPQDLLLYP